MKPFCWTAKVKRMTQIPWLWTREAQRLQRPPLWLWTKALLNHSKELPPTRINSSTTTIAGTHWTQNSNQNLIHISKKPDPPDPSSHLLLPQHPFQNMTLMLVESHRKLQVFSNGFTARLCVRSQEAAEEHLHGIARIGAMKGSELLPRGVTNLVQALGVLKTHWIDVEVKISFFLTLIFDVGVEIVIRAIQVELPAHHIQAKTACLACTKPMDLHRPLTSLRKACHMDMLHRGWKLILTDLLFVVCWAQ